MDMGTGKVQPKKSNIVLRIFAFAIVCAVVMAARSVYDDFVQPASSSALTVSAMNGGESSAAMTRTANKINNYASVMTWGAMILAGTMCFWTPAKRALVPVSMIVLLGFAPGCWRHYDTPEYAEIDTSETAFLVPLEGEGVDQAKFASVGYLEEKKVAAKRVQITHRWNQTGRLDSTGAWIPAVRLIKVNRAPVTREWEAEKDKTKAIWLESQDSVGFSTGFNCTAMIREEDAAKFLYNYRGGTLADIMDSEIRNRIQQVAFEIGDNYPLDQLRGRKQEIIDGVRKDIIPYFADRGITLTMIGMFGGMTYENPQIQVAIDNVFIAQQEKSVNLAKFEAQQKANERIELEAMAQAEKARTQARGEADSKVLSAEGEAKSLLARAQAIKEAGPSLFQLRSLEIEQERVQKWDGKYPVYMFSTGTGAGSPSLMLNVPQPAMGATAAVK